MNQQMPPMHFITTKQAARILGRPESTLRGWRQCGRGPQQWVKHPSGGSVFYLLEGVMYFATRYPYRVPPVEHHKPGGFVLDSNGRTWRDHDNNVRYGIRPITEGLIEELILAGPPSGNRMIKCPRTGLILRHWGWNQGNFAGIISIMHYGSRNNNHEAYRINPHRPYDTRLDWHAIFRAVVTLNDASDPRSHKKKGQASSVQGPLHLC